MAGTWMAGAEGSGQFARRAAALLAALALLALPACDGRPDTDAPTAAAPGARTEHERGPVHVTASLDRASVAVGEKVTLTLEVTAPAGVEITMPDPGDTLGPFAVRARRLPPDVPDADQRRWTHAYVLDTFAAGGQEVSGLTVEFVDRRDESAGSDGEPIRGEIVIDPLAVTVASVLAEDASETDFRDIRGTVEVPMAGDGPARAAWIAGLLAGAAAAALVGYLWWRRRRPTAALSAPPVPAHAWALGELDALAAADLVGKRRFHEFYFRLSDIVRQYIERRFGLMAPERTTEEFLREAERSDVLSAGHRELLRSFLRAADLVKFARHEPTEDEARDALAGARGFVEQTAPTDPDLRAAATEAAA